MKSLTTHSTPIALYNPGYEASIAHGLSHFTPSKSVRQLRHDLAPLPFYYTEPDTLVLLPEPLPPALSHPRFVNTIPRDAELQPWGWAPELAQLMPHTKSLPYSLSTIQSISSRQITIELWDALQKVAPRWLQSYPTPLAIHHCAEVSEELRKVHQKQGVVLKDDYSSSGRGIAFIPPSQNLDESITKRLGKKQQRGAESDKPHKTLFVEAWHQGAMQDIGYEFEIDTTGQVQYLGVSFFLTSKGQYLGNQVAPPEHLEAKARQRPIIPTHEACIQYLTQALSLMPTLRGYRGKLGIDLLLIASPDRPSVLHLTPPLELNCRTTMGHLALALGRTWLTGTQQALLQIHHSPNLHSTLLPQVTSPLPLYLRPPSPLPDPGLYLLAPLFPDRHFAATLRIS